MTTPKTWRDFVECCAEAWASIDGYAEAFAACKADKARDDKEGRYSGYMLDADELLRRTFKRAAGLAVVPREATPAMIEAAEAQWSWEASANALVSAGELAPPDKGEG